MNVDLVDAFGTMRQEDRASAGIGSYENHHGLVRTLLLWNVLLGEFMASVLSSCQARSAPNLADESEGAPPHGAEGGTAAWVKHCLLLVGLRGGVVARQWVSGATPGADRIQMAAAREQPWPLQHRCSSGVLPS